MDSVWTELKRRNVVKVAVLYVVASWLVLQVADVLFVNLGTPDWAFGFVLGLLILFFVPALIFAWIFEITPEGLKRESEVDRSKSIAGETGRRLNLVTIVLLVAVAGLLLADRFVLEKPSDATSPVTTSYGIAIVAVLPFKATGSDDGGFLAAGLHDDLLTRLAKLGAFKVISHTSMMEYANTTKNLRQIGEELGAAYILEGGVQALGDRVRVNAQLIDALADQHVWADTYDRKLDAANLFDIQAELAAAIADQLQTTLSPTDRRVVDDIPTESTVAYNAYLRGLNRHLSGGRDAGNERAVVAAFEEAVELDPDFGLAWARLSIARTRLAWLTNRADMRESALAALARARTLRPDLLETELAWVIYLYRGLHEYQQAVEAAEAVGEKAPLNAEFLAVKAWLYRRLGRFHEAYETLLTAKQLDPRSMAIVNELILSATLIDDCMAAGRHAQYALSVAPDLPITKTYVADYELECTGNTGRASELLRDVGYETDWSRRMAREAALAERDFERALALLEVPLPEIEAWPLNPIFDLLQRSWVLRLMGRTEESAAMLDAVAVSFTAIEQKADLLGSDDFAFAKHSYHSLHGDVEATQYWIAECKRRVREKYKEDRVWEGYYRAFYAANLAGVGLHDEAIEELRTMLEEPGGFGFRRIDAWPDFDVLKRDPGYIELRRRFGEAR